MAISKNVNPVNKPIDEGRDPPKLLFKSEILVITKLAQVTEEPQLDVEPEQIGVPGICPRQRQFGEIDEVDAPVAAARSHIAPSCTAKDEVGDLDGTLEGVADGLAVGTADGALEHA